MFAEHGGGESIVSVQFHAGALVPRVARPRRPIANDALACQAQYVTNADEDVIGAVARRCSVHCGVLMCGAGASGTSRCVLSSDRRLIKGVPRTRARAGRRRVTPTTTQFGIATTALCESASKARRD